MNKETRDFNSIGRISGQASNRPDSSRFSVATYWSLTSENDAEVQDELAKLQKELRMMKLNISTQSKRNFFLERDVRYLDGRIALLIQKKMALSEQQDVAAHLEEVETAEGNSSALDDRKRQLYGNLFHIIQCEPKYIAGLTRVVSLSQIDTLLQTVMFTIFGNQYEAREEYLLLSIFQNILAAEFESATNFAGLIRANTPVSRMMTTYTRRSPGQAYLKQTLSEKVHKVMELPDVDLEINPLKVYDKLINDITEKHGSCSLPKNVSAEEAANHQDVQALIGPRVKTLMGIGASFLSAIMSSVDEIPYGIRWICKQIRSLVKRKFQDSTEAQKCSLIGGFFMLRYINPAIVTPQAYMLIGKEPQAKTKRILTLVAKLLQNLANKPTVTKEQFMHVLNPFVEHNEARFQKFLNQICDVGDFYEALEMEQYIVLSKKEIDLKINLNEIYSTHQYLAQYIDVLAPDKDSHLRTCLRDLGAAPAQLPRTENRVIVLSLVSRWYRAGSLTNDQQITSSLASDSLTSNEFMYHDLKAVIVHLARAFEATKSKVNINSIIEKACASPDEGLKQKGEHGKEMYQILLRNEVIDAEKGNRLLQEEVAEELIHLGSLASSIKKEIHSLQKVFKTVQEHNTYLKAQILTYKSYLQNVRGQTASNNTPYLTKNYVNNAVNHTAKKSAIKNTGSSNQSNNYKSVLKIPYSKLEIDGVIVDGSSTFPTNRQPDIYFTISSCTPVPGSFSIELYCAGHVQSILCLELTLDDLLEKQQKGYTTLDLEYVKLDLSKTIILLNQSFLKGSKRSTSKTVRFQ